MTQVASVIITVTDSVTGHLSVRVARDEALILPGLLGTNPLHADAVKGTLTRLADEARDRACSQAEDVFARQGG